MPPYCRRRSRDQIGDAQSCPSMAKTQPIDVVVGSHLLVTPKPILDTTSSYEKWKLFALSAAGFTLSSVTESAESIWMTVFNPTCVICAAA